MGDPSLAAEQLRAATFVRHIEFHDTLDSTNDRAAELAHDPLLETPALVVARRQTAGRGRGQHLWWAADGALTFSLVLEPARLEIDAADWPRLSLAAAVAVCDALTAELVSSERESIIGIKWPNDVLLAERKVCGILLESPGGAAPAKDRLLIGIGINVNNSWQDAPHDVGQHGTALCDATGRQHNLETVLRNALIGLRSRLAQLAAGAPSLPATWRALCCLTNRAICVENAGRQTEGMCLGISDDGALLVASDRGTERVFSGSVRKE
jgi:BirA family biotin operon repressor/biotin-[acetyl-CoA-carboxylase] ligase